MRPTLAAWLLAATLLIRYDPPSLLLVLDPEERRDPPALVAAEACPQLAIQGVPLPVPWEIVWLRRHQEGAGYATDATRPRLRGMLSRCQP